MRTIKSPKGFTLVELIIVAVVLTALAAVAIPVYQDLQAVNREKAVRSALASVRSAIAVYRENEIASGRASGSMAAGVGATARGWPSLSRVQEWEQCSNCGIGCCPKVMENGDVPDNLYRGLGAQDDRVDTNGAGTATCAALGSPKGTVNGAVLMGWYYNPCTGEFWANSNNVPGENNW